MFKTPSSDSLLDATRHKAVTMKAGEQFRIIELLPLEAGHDPEAPVVCRTVVASLSDDALDYEAVSYVWGDGKDRASVVVDDRLVDISASLDVLFRRLRRPDRTRRVWVDQLCIDQTDVAEKTAQIKVMGDIYARCTNCLIWMGTVPDSVSAADVEAMLQLLRYMATPDLWDVPHCLSSREEFARIFGVLFLIHPDGNSWWKRIWTVQELMLPEKRTVLWGQHELLWTVMMRAIHTWTTTWLQPLHGAMSQEQFDSMNALSANVVWASYSAHKDLPSILVNKWRRRQATDPRDKVFGLRGLVLPSVALTYTDRCTTATPAADVFSALTLDAILAEGSLQPLVLNPRRTEPGAATDDVPGWTMDLGGADQGAADMFYRDWGYRHYNACQSRPLDRDLLQVTVDANGGSTRVLAVPGVKVEEIRVVSPDQNVAPQTDEQISEKLKGWFKLAADYRREKLSLTADAQFEESCWRLVLADLLEVANDETPSRLPNTEDLELARRFAMEGQRERGRLWIKEHHMPSSLFNLAFFVTGSGMMGLAPTDTVPGDQIWILDGGKFPFVLRPRQGGGTNEFDFLGCCYAQGIMFGEFFQQNGDLQSSTLYLH